MSATPEAREKMLEELQKFAFTGIPDFRTVPQLSQVLFYFAYIYSLADFLVLLVYLNNGETHTGIIDICISITYYTHTG